MACQSILAASEKDDSDNSAQERIEEKLVRRKHKTTCLDYFRPMAVFKSALVVGGVSLGIGLVGGAYFGRALMKDLELDESSRKMSSVPIASTGISSIDMSQYAPVFWRKKATNEFYFKALVDALVDDAKRIPELRAKADELGIPISDPQSVFKYLGVFPENARKTKIDRVKIVETPRKYINLDIDVSIGELRQATIKTGPIFSNDYKKMDKLVEEWLKLQYEQDKDYLPGMTFVELNRRIDEAAENIGALHKTEEMLTSGDKISLDSGYYFKTPHTFLTEVEMGTYVRANLDAKLFSGDKFLNWIKGYENKVGARKYPYDSSYGRKFSFTPTFLELNTPKELQQVLQYNFENNKISWLPRNNDPKSNAHRVLLSRFLGKAVYSRLEAHPDWTLEQGVQTVIEEIEK